jgi:hypothetical protein
VLQTISILLKTESKTPGRKRKLTFDNSIHRTTLLAVTAVDALGHINIISGCSSAAVFTFFGLNGDGLSWADGFAEFAGNAALFARGVATEGVFAAESGRDGTFFEGIEDGVTCQC